MKLLAIDSSGLVASVAVMEDTKLLAEYTINNKQTHSQTLLVMLDEVKRILELDLETVDAIAVAAGPGSFTGLRIGSATAKGIGLAIKKPIISVPTLDALAYQMYASDKIICPIMDARRSQVYTGIYKFCQNEKTEEETEEGAFSLEIIEPQCAVPIEKITRKLNELKSEVIFLGDGVPVFSQKLSELMQVGYSFAPAHRNRQSASSVAVRAMELYKMGIYQTAIEHQPEYLRLSQAERERMEKEAKK